MEDLQGLSDFRNVPLERVGISRLALPIKVRQKAGDSQGVAASVSLFVEVPSSSRGTHLSRFVELIGEWADGVVSSTDIKALLEETRRRMNSLSAEVRLRFPYFISKSAPVSGIRAPVDYKCEFRGRVDASGFVFTLGTSVPITTLCPCSRAISNEGAHNQRAEVRVLLSYTEDSFIWLEDLISVIERQGSCEVYSVLKRPDEKYVTEKAYANPKFVEDVVRDVVLELGNLPGVSWFSAECESFESIHNHNAYAAAQQVLIGIETPSVEENLPLLAEEDSVG